MNDLEHYMTRSGELTQEVERLKAEISKITKVVNDVENSYSFMSGGTIPQWEKEWKAFEEARRSILVAIGELLVGDSKEHILSRECWCNPRVATIDKGSR